MTVPAHHGRRDNGLDSEAFAPVADVDPRLGDHLLDVLGLRDIPAYLEPAPATSPVTADRLFVASGQTDDARAVLGQLATELGIEIAREGYQPPKPTRAPALLDGIEIDSAFAAIIAEMPELDEPLTDPPRSNFIVAAEFGVPIAAPLHEDEVEHFVPPTAPPLPRLALGTAVALFVTLFGVLIIAFGSAVGLSPDLPLPLGVLTILFGFGLMFQRLRPDATDDPDDGAIV